MVRFYRNDWPEVGDIVMCKVVEVLDLGSYVELLEYDNIRGMIGISDLSRLRVRHIQKLVNVGKILAAEVLRVDRERKCIDLSKKTVTFEEFQSMETKYEQAKHVHLVVRKVATTLHPSIDLDEAMIKVYDDWVWNMYTEEAHAYDVLKSIAVGSVEAPNEEFKSVCIAMFPPKYITCTGELRLMNIGVEGIDATKRVLKDTLQQYKGLKINYSSQSTYLFTIDVEDANQGCEVINQAMQYSLNKMKQLEGGLGVIEKLATC